MPDARGPIARSPPFSGARNTDETDNPARGRSRGSVTRITTVRASRSHRCDRSEPLRRSHSGCMRSTRCAAGMLALVAAISLPAPTYAAQPPTEINTCGQIFSGNGFLSGDLDCSGFAGDAVTIEGGTLDLQGFTLTSTAMATGPFGAVACSKSCKVVSNPPGGTITSDGSGTIFAILSSHSGVVVPKANLQVSDVAINDGRLFAMFGTITVTDSTITGIVDPLSSGTTFAEDSGVGTFGGVVHLLRSVVTGNAGTGVRSAKVKIVDSEVSNNDAEGIRTGLGTAVIRGSMISGNGLAGISGIRFKVVDTTITGNGTAGIAADLSAGGPPPGRVKVVRSDISSNLGQGITGFPKKIAVRDSTIDNNGSEGIRQDLSETLEGAVVTLTNSTVTGNALDGIVQSASLPRCRLKARGSTVTGNGTYASCGVAQTCADLSSCGLPKVRASTCDTSYDVTSGFPGTSWGVCSLD